MSTFLSQKKKKKKKYIYIYICLTFELLMTIKKHTHVIS